MRINKYVASATGMSRRHADQVIADGRVQVNGSAPTPGTAVTDADRVTLDHKPLRLATSNSTLMLNKPVGYVVSRNGQGSLTVYDLIPDELHVCKPVGRLDKESSGLLLMTTDGDLAQKLTHPSLQKRKVYEVRIDADLQPLHRQLIGEKGIMLADGISKLGLERLLDGDDTRWIVTMREGRNRQIRRTFQALGYGVLSLHRIQFGEYALGDLPTGEFQLV